MSQLSTFLFALNSIAAGTCPDEPRALSASISLGPAQLSATFDFSADRRVAGQFGLQGIFIDASAAPGPVSVTFPATEQTITIKGGYQGYFPVLPPDPTKAASMTLTVSVGAAAANFFLGLQLLNVAVQPGVWPAA